MAGRDWEVVSLTASTYAAAPGPTSPPFLLQADADADADAAQNREFPPLLLVPNPPAHFFMSQHFNLPAREPAGEALFSTHLLQDSGCQELEESGPAVVKGDAADADHLNLNMPCPCPEVEGERDDAPLLASPAAATGLQVEEGGGGDAAGACSDAAALPAPAACNCNAAGQAQAWWEKTFSFPRSNGTQPLAFRFVFVAGKLQIQEEDLVPEFGAVHSQTHQKVSCVSEPLGEVKVGMLGGGSPVAQQG